jgi:hypothetical protein
MTLRQGQSATVDPLWIALYSMVMAVAVEHISTDSTNSSNPYSGYTREDLSQIATRYRAMSLKALHLGDYMNVPRVRTIQTILLFGQPRQGLLACNTTTAWTSVAIRTAQLLGLHILGTNPEIMPPDDPAWPPGKNALKRHVALRLWTMLQHSDWISAPTSRCYQIHPDQCNTQLVENINDWELSYTRPPVYIATSSSFEICKWRIADMLRKTYDKLVTQSERFSYSNVLELDQGYRDILDTLPVSYRSDYVPPHAEDSKLRSQRDFVLDAIHSRLLRLHRPFLTKGYEPSSKYTDSKEKCLTSALTLIDRHYQTREHATAGKFWCVLLVVIALIDTDMDK